MQVVYLIGCQFDMWLYLFFSFVKDKPSCKPNKKTSAIYKKIKKRDNCKGKKLQKKTVCIFLLADTQICVLPILMFVVS